MQSSSFALYAAVGALALCFALTAQERPAAKPTPNSSPVRHAARQVVNLKLTDRQRQGIKLLKVARADAAALEPAMRAVVLEQIAVGYDKVNPTRAQAIRYNAFLVSLGIEEGTWSRQECLPWEVCQTKWLLQAEILSAMVSRSAVEVERLLPRAEPQAQLQVTNWLISKYTEKKNFDRAEELITQLSAEGGFPYPAAIQLLQSLPGERSSDRLTLFLQALDNFRTFGNSLPQFADLGTMLNELWRQLPPPVVLDAIDSMLDKAKADDEKEDKALVTLQSKRGNASFSSAYEYRLFQLLPMLKEIDKDRAETLLRDQQNLRATMQVLPDGPQSLWKTPESGETLSMAVRRGDFPRESASDQLDQQLFEALERREEQIRKEGIKDPRAALTDAATLPLKFDSAPWRGSPRANMLLEIAFTAMMKAGNPSAARDVLDELQKVVDNLSVAEQGHFLADSGELYYVLRDKQALEKTVKKSLKIAQKLYERDSDPSDPNLALKAKWPSANLWWRTARMAARISPGYASGILAEIPDPEIRTFVKVAFGNTLLGTFSLLGVQERHRGE